jgi:hypothetical protein
MCSTLICFSLICRAHPVQTYAIQADLIWSDYPFRVILFFAPFPEHFPRGALARGARGEAVALRRARAPRLLCAWHAHLARGIQQVRRARFLHNRRRYSSF